jgi:hypothetical protein
VLQLVEREQDHQPFEGEREAVDRRRRAVAPGRRQIAEAVGQKVLHGFLQNRHQTLMPLSVNLARLAEADRAALARFAAVAARAGRAEAAPDPVRTWILGAGADPALLAAFDAALRSPPPLDAALAALREPETALIAFILCLIAARGAGPAGWAFADYVALHRALPTAAVRAAERRYRT